MIYGISGKRQSGKDTIANIWEEIELEYFCKNIKKLYNDPKKIENSVPYQKRSFANNLKKILCILFNIDINNFENETFKNTLIPIKWGVWKNDKRIFTTKEEADNYNKFNPSNKVEFYIPTYRIILQELGTNLFRELFNPNVWSISLFSNYDINSKWLITDVRFTNEANTIKALGGKIIRVIRNKNYINEHVSERDLDNYNSFDYIIINDGNLNDLKIKVKKIMIMENIINDNEKEDTKHNL